MIEPILFCRTALPVAVVHCSGKRLKRFVLPKLWLLWWSGRISRSVVLSHSMACFSRIGLSCCLIFTGACACSFGSWSRFVGSSLLARSIFKYNAPDQLGVGTWLLSTGGIVVSRSDITLHLLHCRRTLHTNHQGSPSGLLSHPQASSPR